MGVWTCARGSIHMTADPAGVEVAAEADPPPQESRFGPGCHAARAPGQQPASLAGRADAARLANNPVLLSAEDVRDVHARLLA